MGSNGIWGGAMLWPCVLCHHAPGNTAAPCTTPPHTHPRIHNHFISEWPEWRGGQTGNCKWQLSCPSANSAPDKCHVSSHRSSTSVLTAPPYPLLPVPMQGTCCILCWMAPKGKCNANKNNFYLTPCRPRGSMSFLGHMAIFCWHISKEEKGRKIYIRKYYLMYTTVARSPYLLPPLVLSSLCPDMSLSSHYPFQPAVLPACLDTPASHGAVCIVALATCNDPSACILTLPLAHRIAPFV